MQRRSLLTLGVAAGAVLALAGGVSLMVESAWREGKLLPAGRAVLAAVARAVLDGSLPKAASIQAAAIDAHLARLEAAVRAMPAHTQGEIAELLTLLALPPGRLALTGLGSNWAEASTLQIQLALQSMRLSSLQLRRQAYQALRDLTNAAYFADASTWVLLGYPGPRALT